MPGNHEEYKRVVKAVYPDARVEVRHTRGPEFRVLAGEAPPGAVQVRYLGKSWARTRHQAWATAARVVPVLEKSVLERRSRYKAAVLAVYPEAVVRTTPHSTAGIPMYRVYSGSDATARALSRKWRKDETHAWVEAANRVSHTTKQEAE